MSLTKQSYHAFLAILKEELVPALGCTEPIAIAYAAAKAREVLGIFPEKIIVRCSGNIIKNAKCFVAATSGNVGFIAGGDELKLFGYRGLFKENDIKQLSEKWWEYWNDYWKKRGTESAYDKDYACEVTIPVRS